MGSQTLKSSMGKKRRLEKVIGGRSNGLYSGSGNKIVLEIEC